MQDHARIRFLGALGRVTGSSTLLHYRGRYYLVDCGIRQEPGTGEDGLPIPASKIAAVFLTHAHMDHCGLLPWLVRHGFKGKVWCTRPTADLTRLSLLDGAGHEGARYNKRDVGRVEFCTMDDQEKFGFGKFIAVQDGLTFSVFRTAHVLGSVGFEFQFNNGREEKRTTLVFSGDLGNNSDDRYIQPLLNTRQHPSTHAQYIVCESTYGSRVRQPDHADPVKRRQELAEALKQAATRGENPLVIIPSFTLQRMQDILVDLNDVLSQADDKEWQVGKVAVTCESGLAQAYTKVFLEQLQRKRENGKPFWLHPEFELARCNDGNALEEVLRDVLDPTGFTYSFEDSTRPEVVLQIVLAGAGMCHAGKVVDYLKENLGKKETTVLMVGYQSPGLPGGRLMKMARNPGTKEKIAEWDIEAKDVAATVVDCSPYYSGHADQAGLLDFLLTQNARKNQVYESVRRVFLNHGENESRAALRAQILQTQGSIGKRSVEAVECPAPDCGWFDLVENRWVEGFDPGIDDSSFQIACLQSRLERIEAILAKAGLGGLPEALRPDLNGWKDVSKIDLLKPEQAAHALERDCARRNKA